jgi:hypothetical protein
MDVLNPKFGGVNRSAQNRQQNVHSVHHGQPEETVAISHNESSSQITSTSPTSTRLSQLIKMPTSTAQLGNLSDHATIEPGKFHHVVAEDSRSFNMSELSNTVDALLVQQGTAKGTLHPSPPFPDFSGPLNLPHGALEEIVSPSSPSDISNASLSASESITQSNSQRPPLPIPTEPPPRNNHVPTNSPRNESSSFRPREEMPGSTNTVSVMLATARLLTSSKDFDPIVARLFVDVASLVADLHQQSCGSGTANQLVAVLTAAFALLGQSTRLQGFRGKDHESNTLETPNSRQMGPIRQWNEPNKDGIIPDYYGESHLSTGNYHRHSTLKQTNSSSDQSSWEVPLHGAHDSQTPLTSTRSRASQLNSLGTRPSSWASPSGESRYTSPTLGSKLQSFQTIRRDPFSAHTLRSNSRLSHSFDNTGNAHTPSVSGFSEYDQEVSHHRSHTPLSISLNRNSSNEIIYPSTPRSSTTGSSHSTALRNSTVGPSNRTGGNENHGTYSSRMRNAIRVTGLDSFSPFSPQSPSTRRISNRSRELPPNTREQLHVMSSNASGDMTNNPFAL